VANFISKNRQSIFFESLEEWLVASPAGQKVQSCVMTIVVVVVIIIIIIIVVVVIAITAVIIIIIIIISFMQGIYAYIPEKNHFPIIIIIIIIIYHLVILCQ
jgi:hypothetical protein